MERLRHIYHRVRTHGGLVGHLETRYTGLVGLPGKRHHFELHVEQLGEIVGCTQWRVRQVAEAFRGHLQLLDTALDLAHRVKIITDDSAVPGIELTTEACSL